MYDTADRPYLDALASLWYCNVGYGRTVLADAAAAQMRRLAAFHAYEVFTNEPAEALARRVADLVPVPDAKVFFTPGGGSDAIDTAAKLARAYWRAVGKPGKQFIVVAAWIRLSSGRLGNAAPPFQRVVPCFHTRRP